MASSQLSAVFYAGHHSIHIPKSIESCKIAHTLNCSGLCCRKKYTVLKGKHESAPSGIIQIYALEGITAYPANQCRHTEAVERLLLVVAARVVSSTVGWAEIRTVPNELWYWQGAFETQCDESQDVNEEQ